LFSITVKNTGNEAFDYELRIDGYTKKIKRLAVGSSFTYNYSVKVPSRHTIEVYCLNLPSKPKVYSGEIVAKIPTAPTTPTPAPASKVEEKKVEREKIPIITAPTPEITPAPAVAPEVTPVTKPAVAPAEEKLKIPKELLLAGLGGLVVLVILFVLLRR